MDLRINTTNVPSPKPKHNELSNLYKTEVILNTQLPPSGNSPPTPNFFHKYAEKYLKTRHFALTVNNYNNYNNYQSSIR